MRKKKTTAGTEQPEGTDDKVQQLPVHVSNEDQTPGTDEEQEDVEVTEVIQKDVQIFSASIDGDDRLNYTFEVLTGIGKGDMVDREGKHRCHQDLIDAMKKLELHMAIVDDLDQIGEGSFYDGEFLFDKDDQINYAALNTLRLRYSEGPFTCTGFVLSDLPTSGNVKILGTKHVLLGIKKGDTPKFDVDGSYKLKKVLQEDLQNILSEVEKYMLGKSRPELVQQEMFKGDPDAGVPEDNFHEAETSVAEGPKMPELPLTD